MYQHIMVPLDGSELAECVIPHLDAVAGGGSIGKITLVSVIEPLHIRGGLDSRLDAQERERLEESDIERTKSYLDQIVKQLKYKSAAIETKVLHGNVIDELNNYASSNGVDLIIMSTHGRSGVSRLVWGSVADQILRSICVPVLMVRVPGCVMGV